MPGGSKVVQFNTQERAVSTDLNRLQTMAGAGLAEVFRYLMDVSTNDDLDAGAVITEYSASDTPLRAEVVNGLLVKPQSGSLNLLVDAGVLFAIAPDADPDASNYKLVRDPGVTVLGTLALTPNPAGSDRIDVIEVQVSSVITETDSRDVFNPATGLFAATSITKARQSTVTFVGAATNIRVRAGVAGGGFPGSVLGWLPLAVANVTAGSTTNNTVTFWDVRPLLNDRCLGPGNITRDMPLVTRVNFDLAVGGVTKGVVEATSTVGACSRRLGGRLRRGSPGTDAESIDLSSAANQEAGFTFPGAGGGIVYLYLMTVGGLPRWARYTDGPAGRVPRSPRGIPVLSTVPPTSLRGTPSSAISMPAATGLGFATAEGICVGAFWATASLAVSALAEGFTVTIGPDAFGESVMTPIVGVNAVGSATFALTDGTTHPANARAIWVSIGFTLSVAAGSDQSFLIDVGCTRPGGGAKVSVMPIYAYAANSTGGPVTKSFRGLVRIPLTTGYPAATEAARTVVATILGITPLTSAMQIHGWEIGP